MANDNEQIKIRALPRKNEKPKEATASKGTEANPRRRWIVYVGTTSCLLLAFTILMPLKPKAPAAKRQAAVQAHQQELASVTYSLNDSVQRYMQEAAVKRHAMVRAREMENLKAHPVADSENDFAVAATGAGFGVQLDQEDSAEKMYRELNGAGVPYADTLPEDKINSRLANRRWVNEFERRERINFVKNFLRSAYDRGYEVQLDQNLVVVGVKKINRTQKVNIDQVIDRMARQGL